MQCYSVELGKEERRSDGHYQAVGRWRWTRPRRFRREGRNGEKGMREEWCIAFLIGIAGKREKEDNKDIP